MRRPLLPRGRGPAPGRSRLRLLRRRAPAASGGTRQVRVGVIPILDVAPIYLGKQKGFFSSRGIELTMETGQGGAAIVPGVVSGQFQFGFSNVTSLLIAQSRGLPLKVVANGVASTSKDKADYSGVVTRDDAIRTAADLAGGQVAVNTLKNIATRPSGPRSVRPAATRRRSSSPSCPSPTCRRRWRRAAWTPSGWWSRS
jgi:ABC-type nitrate/sulfonate/bicarbonate transport system substrate-binding protein